MRRLTAGILVLAVLIFVAANFLSAVLLKDVSFDVTKDKIYTLSHNSKEIINEIKVPITLRFFYSTAAAKENHYLANYAARVKSMLEQYQKASNGKIMLEVIDPKPFSRQEELALEYGLQGIKLKEQEVYFGLVGSNTLDNQQVIPFFMPNREGNLEYDITQLIYNVSEPEPKIIGVMNALPLRGIDGRPWTIRTQLDELFVVKDIDLQEPLIPNYVSVLMVVEPSAFPNDAILAIDEFVQRGGHILAFVDPYSELAGKPTGAGNATALLRSWGVELLNDYVVADKTLARSVRISHNNHDMTVNYPLWMDFTTNNFFKEDVITAGIDRMTLATPGHLQHIASTGTYFMPLIYTSNEAMLIPDTDVADSQSNIVSYFNQYHPDGQFTVAARVSGEVTSPFTKSKIDQANIILLADSDMLHDHFWVSNQNIMGGNYDVASSGNGNFVLSALDNLLGSNQLISIRNRGDFSRPFTKIQELERALLDNSVDIREAKLQLSEKINRLKYLIEFLTFGLLPIIIIGTGLIMYLRSHNRRAA